MYDNVITRKNKRRKTWSMHWFEIKQNFSAIGFCLVFLSYWLFYMLFIGWRHYLFKPVTYLIVAGDILADIEASGAIGCKAHPFWWSRINCNAARDAASLNHSDAIVRFTLRPHPIFLDNEILTVRSHGYNRRIWKED